MNNSFFSGMNDEQIALWRQQNTRIKGLEDQLAQERADRENELRHWRAEFDRLSAEVRDALDRGLRARNQLMILAEHVPPILAQWIGSLEPFTDEALTPEFRRQRQNVRELTVILEEYMK